MHVKMKTLLDMIFIVPDKSSGLPLKNDADQKPVTSDRSKDHIVFSKYIISIQRLFSLALECKCLFQDVLW